MLDNCTGGEQMLGCVGHVLNLAAKAGLQKLQDKIIAPEVVSMCVCQMVYCIINSYLLLGQRIRNEC